MVLAAKELAVPIRPVPGPVTVPRMPVPVPSLKRRISGG